MSLWRTSRLYVLPFLCFFSFILHAEEDSNWCNTANTDYVIEWDVTNSKDLFERTLLVKNKSSGNIFATLNGEASPTPEISQSFYLDDYNFDGCQDISWVSGMNARGDVTYTVFLYSQPTRKFIYSDDLSAISNLKISQQPNCLSESEANTYEDFYGGTSSTYCWIKGKLVETERSELSLDSEHKCAKFRQFRLNNDGFLSLTGESCERFVP